MNIKETLQKNISGIIAETFQLNDVLLEVQENKTDFEGDFTIVIFPLVKHLKKNPEIIGNELGEAVKRSLNFVESFNVVKGFLNLKINSQFFIENFKSLKESFGKVSDKNETVMVEYSSPNTNKPLHLGHIRNNLLGFSVSQILKEAGYNVIKTQIINDRGIHICKSMLAWDQFGNGETPASSQIKGDKLVGNYYVEFDKNYKKEISELMSQGLDEETAKKQAPSILAAS